ncbi:DUF4350 domain-containing protein [Actinoplanes derwentensis]|uniref:DUF4350 domain-containing protein n=1 Tax=Actinoplanes derwentensis TaxID=113562 RepID=A0A1H1WH62_9ACTN|nr:DUF4350 domain-containing protein [Actinoplanes derwentensis]GID87439.1 hypothetical protein Ade03nite_63630 [Actinoplanes derwentensis]SDS96627.1 hypothetical protein SAMN04489716_2111 [Actinoplanes derwentensis]
MKRWTRVAIPFATLTALITGTLIVHAIQTPDADDPAFLAPDRVHDISGGTLAERLRAQGIQVDRATSTEDAITAAGTGPAVTLFLPTPDLADLTRVRGLPAGTRVVAVNPSDGALRRSNWPVETAGSQWTTRVTVPGCADPLAVAAGPAAVLRTAYQPQEDATVCYAGAMVTMRVDDTYTVTVVGSPDPFRDDRISEHGNAALAVGLLSQRDRVVWLDVHERDRPVPSSPPPTYETPPPPAATGPGEGRPQEGAPGEPGDGTPTGTPTGTSGARGPEKNPLFQAFPPALWATLALLALILIALAAAAARRLGTPVAEPLPSRVPANETMLGHARLYQRARARQESLDILVAAARRRLTRHLGLPPDAPVEDIAAHAGLPVRYVRDILDGEPPRSNADMVESAALLQALVDTVTASRHHHEGEQS